MKSPRNPNGVRLQRALADAGVASRRECEAMIARGDVRVNGEIKTDLPVFVNPRTDSVTVNGRKVELDGSGGTSRGRGRSEVRRVYIAMNKPDRTLATTKDDPYGALAPEGEEPRGARRTVLDLIDDKNLGRLFPVGRLGFHDTGLVILTNDGELANRLTHARYGVPRTYIVFVRGRVPEDVLDRMRERLAASLGADHPRAGDPVRVLTNVGSETELEVTLRESPKLRIDALIFDAGLKVKRLVRTAIGPISIRGIVSGNWRHLNRNDLDELMVAAGLSDAPAGKPGASPQRRDGVNAKGLRRSLTAKTGPRSAGRGAGASGGGGSAGGGSSGGAKTPASKGPRRILPARKSDQRGGAKR